MKKVLIAESAGFCWGVKRAVERVTTSANASKEPVYTYGPLIHNPQEVREMEKKGIFILDEIPDKFDGVIFIRTHGLSPAEREKLKKSGATIVDATCPDVGSIQGVIKKTVKQGYFVIIVGDAKHPEVKALLGFAGTSGMVIMTDAEVSGVPRDKGKVCVVAQSTQKEGHFEQIVQRIKKIYPEAEVFNTICKSTTRRQEEASALAKKVDVMVVVGGHNSANTAKLAQICGETGTRTFHIETEEELTPADFKEHETIGVTAGASTPTWLIERVVEKLRGM